MEQKEVGTAALLLLLCLVIGTISTPYRVVVGRYIPMYVLASAWEGTASHLMGLSLCVDLGRLHRGGRALCIRLLCEESVLVCVACSYSLLDRKKDALRF